MSCFGSGSPRSPWARALALASLVLLSTALAPTLSFARPAAGDESALNQGGGDKSIDTDAHIDANSLDMWMTNIGSFGWDMSTGDPGLLYPIGTTMPVLFAGGLWIFGMSDEGIRGAIAEYSMEYTPGVIFPDSGWADPSDPRYRVYKLSRASGPGDPDYDEWPIEDGAPLGADGEPLLIGEQTLWSVFHDADPAKHTNTAGNTDPIGVEVAHLTYAFDLPDPLDRVIVMDYKLTHKGPLPLTETYVGFWLDTDIGEFTDDVAGSDSLLQAAFAYNGDGFDEIYGPVPPALAVTFLGDEDRSAHAAIAYINGTDPASPYESYNYIQGLAIDGSPVIDPTTGQPTRFWYGGDPSTGEGWIDTSPSDKRVMLSFGPFDFERDQVEELRVALVVGQGPDRISSVEEMKTGIRIVRRLHEKGAFVTPEEWKLAGFYPQPFCAGWDPFGWTFVTAPNEGAIRVRIVDESNALVRILIEGMDVSGGIHPLFWDGADDFGEPVAPGTYAFLLGVKDPESPVQRLVWDREVVTVTCPSAHREPGSAIARRLLSADASVARGRRVAMDEGRTVLVLSGSGVITFTAHSRREWARLDIFDVLGRRIRSIGPFHGSEALSWDGRDQGGQEIRSGLYFYKVSRGSEPGERGRVLLVR